MIVNKIERIAKILELAEISYTWLKFDDDGNGVSLILDDNSSTVSFAPPDMLRIFASSDVSFSSYEQTDIATPCGSSWNCGTCKESTVCPKKAPAQSGSNEIKHTGYAKYLRTEHPNRR